MIQVVKQTAARLIVGLMAVVLSIGVLHELSQPERAMAADGEGDLVAQALDVNSPRVSVGGVSVLSGVSFPAGDGTVKWTTDGGKITITLTNATVNANAVGLSVAQGEKASKVPVELVVNGNNTLSYKSSTRYTGGVLFGNCPSVTVSGAGTLGLSGYAYGFSWGNDTSGYTILKSGSLTVNGPTVATGGKPLCLSNAPAFEIKQGSVTCGDIDVDDYKQSGGTVKAGRLKAKKDGKSATLTERIHGSFTQSGGTLSLASADYRTSVLQATTVTVTGGTLSIANSYAYPNAKTGAIDAGTLSIKGCKATLSAATASSFAVFADTVKAADAASLTISRGIVGSGISFKDAAGNVYKSTTEATFSQKTFTVTLTGGANAKKASVNTVKVGGCTYKVTVIGSKAFAKKSKLASATLGANVKTIGASAFSGSKKLKTLTVKSTALTKANVKNSLKGSSIKKVKVPAKKVKAYKKVFTKKNAGKSVKVVKA